MDGMTVENIHRWGLLIKTWATGKSYFDGTGLGSVSIGVPIQKLPVPRTVDEVRAQAGSVGVGLVIPQNIKGLAVVQYSSDTLVLRLPPKDRIEAREAKLADGSTSGYEFPDFYKSFMERPLPLSLPELLEAHASRIGDYTISMCA
jgi:hypothetical protein